MLLILFQLLIGHAVADFALQSEVMSKGKNRHRKPDYIPEGQKFVSTWGYWMSAHCLIHAGAVYIVTGIWWLAVVQFVFHFILDFIKSDNLTNPNQDQLLHCIVLVATALIASLI